MNQSSDDELKKKLRMKTIYKALEEGWTVKKSSSEPRTFELTKDTLDKLPIDDNKHPSRRKAISTPVAKNTKV